MSRRDLADTIRRTLASGAPDQLAQALEQWENEALAVADADGLVAVLAECADIAPLVADHHGECFLFHLALLFQNDATDEATRALRDRGVPHLARLFDAAMTIPECPAAPLLTASTAFALYVYPLGVARVAAAVRRFPDEFAWEVVFGLFAEENHPHGPDLAAQLRDPLPTGFAAVALLDLSNVLTRQGRLPAHPFDTPSGRELLTMWAAEPGAGPYGCAASAAEALLFLGPTRNPTDQPTE